VKIGERIARYREKCGMSQEELAQLLGYKSKSTINKIEKGNRTVPKKMILRLSSILDVTPLDILGESIETILHTDTKGETQMKSKKNQSPLVIEIDNGERETGVVIRVSDKANALLEDVTKKSKKSKSYIASKMIEYAYEYIEYSGE
jgi:transcriptional regulator with XRE-family HTH domain